MKKNSVLIMDLFLINFDITDLHSFVDGLAGMSTLVYYVFLDLTLLKSCACIVH